MTKSPSESQAAADTIRSARRLLKKSVACLTNVDDARAHLTRSAAGFVRARELEALREIPLASVGQAGGRNLRVKALQDAGFTNLAQLATLSPGELARYPGIGLQSANALSLAVNEVTQEVRKTIPMQVVIDPPDHPSLQLIHALMAKHAIEVAVSPIESELRRISRELPVHVDAASIATHPWRYRFAGAKRRAGALTAIEAMQQWKSWAQDPVIAGRLVAATTVIESSSQASEPEDLVRNFEQNAARFYAELERLLPRRQERPNGLPQSLIDNVDSLELGTGLLRARLRRYQEFGAKYAIAQKRVLIGDEMGLGKTIQALAAMAHLRETSGASHFLVVCPAAVVINWVRETRQHTDLVPTLVHGSERDVEWLRWAGAGGVAVTTFDTLKGLERGVLGRLDLLVVDEAHYVKNPRANRTLAVKWAAGWARGVIFLSGTPMQNRLEEFRNLVRILQPALADRLSASSAIAGPKAFQSAVAPVYLRRNADEVAQELPELTEVEEWEEFSGPDLRVYRRAVEAGNFMWMRRSAYESAQSAKLERLLELCEEAHQNHRKVIVFSFFRDVLERVASTLPAPVFGPITGDLASHRRQELVDAFSRSSDAGTLVAQITAGGEGLNIQAASVVVLCEPQIKPAMEQQAIARARRLGQTKRVQVHRLLVADSVDQRMLEILGQKQRLFDAFVKHSYVADRSVAAKDASPADIAREVVRLERERLGISA